MFDYFLDIMKNNFKESVIGMTDLPNPFEKIF